MLKKVKVGDKVVAFPYGVGTVKSTESCSYFSVEVEFENANGVMHRHAFSLEGEIISWQHVVSCWTIKNAPEWIWGYFEKPKIKRPFEKWARVDEFGDVTSIFDTEEEMKSCAFRAPLSNRFNAKITGEIEYEVGD